jgi:3-hydroxybutyryl-CoA dehydrogenase
LTGTLAIANPEPRQEKEQAMAIAKVGIIGAGTMGSGIATNLILHGIDVVLLDADPVQIERAQDVARTFFDRSVEKGRMIAAEALAAQARLTAATDLAELRYAHLVIEAVFEDADLKARLFERLSEVLELDTLVATNTSCLRVSDLQRHMRAPERFLGLHYFSPAAINPIVEVIKGEATAESVVERALAFCRRTGKLPLRCKDSYGFAINRFFCPYTNEAARLVDERVAGPAEIDAAAREAVGAAAGPFTVMNLIKPRINLHAIKNLRPLGPFYAPARSMSEVGEADRAWEIGGASELPAATRGVVVDRLRLGVFLPVLQSLDEGIAPPEDIDLGAQEALKFARPPCALMDELGRAEVERIVAPALDGYALEEPASLARVGRLRA